MTKIEMGISDYLRVLRRRIPIALLFLVLTLAATIFYTGRQTPVYSATSFVRVEQRKSTGEALTELIFFTPGDVMDSQVMLIRSFQILERATDKLKITNPQMGNEERMTKVKSFQSQITTKQEGSTNIISISAVSNDPRQAARIANTVAQAYAEAHFEAKMEDTTKAKLFVKTQLDRYQQELEESEEALKEFVKKNPLIVETNMRTPPFSETDPAVTTVKQQIVLLESELRSLESRYTSDYPEVLAKLDQVEKAKANLMNVTNQLTLKQKDFSLNEIQYLKLKRNINLAEDLYAMFKRKYEEFRILEAEKAQDVSVIELALSPTKPIKPNTKSNLLIGLLCGLLVGIIAAFIKESLDSSLGGIEDIEKLLKLPVLGTIPGPSWTEARKGFRWKIRKRSRSSQGTLEGRLPIIFDPFSVTAEAYRALQTNLDLLGLKKGGKKIMIASSTPQEGKTQTLFNLSIAISQVGKKVLIIGSDFRKPVASRFFGLNKNLGLSDILLDEISLDKAVYPATDVFPKAVTELHNGNGNKSRLRSRFRTEKILKTEGLQNLFILPSGKRPPNPFGLLNHPKMGSVVQELAARFDVLLFDTPPVLPVADSVILATHMDEIILVYEAGKTSKYALARAKAQLENVGGKILGVVLNNVKPHMNADLTPYQRYRYSSEDEDADTDKSANDVAHS